MTQYCTLPSMGGAKRLPERLPESAIVVSPGGMSKRYCAPLTSYDRERAPAVARFLAQDELAVVDRGFHPEHGRGRAHLEAIAAARRDAAAHGEARAERRQTEGSVLTARHDSLAVASVEDDAAG